MLSSRVRRDFANIVRKHGNTVIVYNPTITYNDEGDPTYSMGTGTSALAVLTGLDQEEMQFKIEGLDINDSYMAFLEYDNTVTKNTIIFWKSKYYKIFSRDPVYESDDSCFYNLIISHSDIHMILTNTINSNAKIVAP